MGLKAESLEVETGKFMALGVSARFRGGGVWVGLHNWRAAVVSEMVALLSCSLRFSVLPGGEPGGRGNSAGTAAATKEEKGDLD